MFLLKQENCVIFFFFYAVLWKVWTLLQNMIHEQVKTYTLYNMLQQERHLTVIKKSI